MLLRAQQSLQSHVRKPGHRGEDGGESLQKHVFFGWFLGFSWDFHGILMFFFELDRLFGGGQMGLNHGISMEFHWIEWEFFMGFFMGHNKLMGFEGFLYNGDGMGR